MKPTLLILAAGIGSRYGSLKQLDHFGPSGETIIEYSVFDAIRSGFGKVVFVIREELLDQFEGHLSSKFKDKIKVEYAFQKLHNIPEAYTVPEERVKPWGTGHAILSAEDKIDGPFVVINADDFYGFNAFKTIAEYFVSVKSEDEQYCMVGYQLKNTLSDYGTVSRGICNTDSRSYLINVTERTKIQKVDGVIKYQDTDESWHTLNENDITSMNFWGFPHKAFSYTRGYFEEFIKTGINDIKSEFYIPTIISKMINDNNTKVKVLQSAAQWFGVTYKEEKEEVKRSIQILVKNGVYPNNLWG